MHTSVGGLLGRTLGSTTVCPVTESAMRSRLSLITCPQEAQPPLQRAAASLQQPGSQAADQQRPWEAGGMLTVSRPSPTAVRSVVA